MKYSNNAEIIRVFYFKLKNSFLENDKDLKYNYKFLKKTNKSNWNLLKPHEVKDLESMLICIEKGIKYYDFNSNEDNNIEKNNFSLNPSCNFFEKEETLKKEFTKNFDKFKEFANSKTLKILGYEVETSYGNVDILAEDKESRTIHIIELKIGIVDHKIVGQVLKYGIHFQRKLINNTYDFVNLIVVAGDYNEFAYKALKRLNVKMFIYKTINDEFYLHQV
jgi:RecB family endonuclease NucS